MQDGASVANVHLLKGLTSLGVKIDLISIAGENDPCSIEEIQRVCGISELYVLRKKSGGSRFRLKGMIEVLLSLISRPWLAVTLGAFSKNKVRNEISAILAQGSRTGEKWDSIVYDGLHVAAHSSAFGLFRKPSKDLRVIYRAHNVESDIWKRKATLTHFLPLRWFFVIQTALMQRFENSLVRQSDSVMTVSDTDLDIFRGTCPEMHGTTVPIGYEFTPPPALPQNSERLLFLGRLDWPPNRDGLLWFLENVWPEAHRRRPSLELVIAGSGDTRGLKEKLALPGVTFLGRVASVEKTYEESVLSLVPIFYGSGTRVKAIEASRFGRACLSTAIGIEGLGLERGKTYFQAETADEWIQTLVGLDVQQAAAIGLNAHDLLKKSFHLPIAAQKFLSVTK